MVVCLQHEIQLQKSFLNGEEIQTIYFGGGTPSILSERHLNNLLSEIHKNFTVNQAAEITLEANPDDLAKENLSAFKNAGINRLSIGIQSFQNDLLRFLNRAHNAAYALSSFQHARDIGFSNISIDLIYAIPGLTYLRWQKDIDQAVDLEPEHMSCYSLTIEKKTAFGKWASSGKLIPVDDDTAARQLEQLMDSLEANGYEHYEISNFSKPGMHSRHNSSYWRQEKYLGIGPSAHSYDKRIRQFNVANNALYQKAIRNGQIPAEVETLSAADTINEYLLTTLRTKWGTDLGFLKNEYHHNLNEQNKMYIQQLLEMNLAKLDADILTLTRKGKLLADKIASDLFV